MNTVRDKVFAFLESFLLFVLVVLIFKLIQASPLGRWELDNLPGRMVEYVCAAVIPVALLLLLRRKLSEYGFSLHDPRGQLRAAALAALPFLTISLALHYIGWRTWGTSILISLIEAGIFILLTRLLRIQPSPQRPAGMVATFLPLLVLNLALVAETSYLLRLVYSLFFAALGEEILFRGYIQTRLNAAFGQKFALLGFSFGWGWLIAGLFFSAWHILIPFNPLISQYGLDWTWGLWTFFLGLLLGFLRERTRGIGVPVFLHWLINL